MNDDLFVIDFETRGNVIRLYYGNDPDYWGDDWDDKPYEVLKIYYGDKKKDVEENIYRMFGKLLSEVVK